VSGNVVHVWNVAAAQPVLVDSLTIPGVLTTGDVQVSDDGALLAVATEPAGSLVLYSLADPARPQLVTRYASAALAAGVHTAQLARVDGRLHAFCAVNPGAEGPARLVVLDLADPAAPREVLVQPMGIPFIHDTFVRDGILMTANWSEGLVLWDIGGGGRGGTVARPVRLSAIATAPVSASAGPSVHNAWWFHDPTAGGAAARRFVFVGEESTLGMVFGSSSAGDLHVVDVSDLAAPREVAVYGVPNAGVHNVVMDEAQGILYAAFYNGGVRALDVRGDLSVCAAAQRRPDGRCDLRLMGRELGAALASGGPAGDTYVWGVELAGGKLFASDMLNGLWALQPVTR
jgi:hypothetical protein